MRFHMTLTAHKDRPDCPLGTTVEYEQDFADVDQAARFMDRINRHFRSLPYHVSNATHDSGNFACAYISHIWDWAGDEFADAYRRHNPRPWEVAA